jgi:hypothetical protein
MASDTLDLLDDIVRGAEAATGKGPGQPLRAQDWNTLAEAVARLARLAASRERNEGEALSRDYARADHEHIGEVGLTWFDAPTRALVEARGGATDMMARMDGLARDTKALGAQVGSLAAEVERLRTALTEANSGNIVRDADLRRFGNRLDGVIDLERRITALDGRLTGVSTDLRAALDFRDTLRDATGAPLDVAGLATRIDTLAAQQDRLRLADGEVVRIRDFENRIATLESEQVSANLLDRTVDSRLGALATAPDSAIVRGAAEAAASRLDPRLAALETGMVETRDSLGGLRITADADRATLAALDARHAATATRAEQAATELQRLAEVPTRMSTLEGQMASAGIRLATVDSLAADLATVRQSAEAGAALAPRLGELEAVNSGFNNRLAAAEAVTAAVPDLRGRIDAAEAAATAAGALAGRIAAAEGSLATIGSRLAVTESRIGAIEPAVERLSVTERSLTELTSWRRGVDDRLGSLPSRADLAGLTSRIVTVEQRAADQQIRLNEINLRNVVLRRPV